MRRRRLRVEESEALILALTAMVTESHGRMCYYVGRQQGPVPMPPAIEDRVRRAMLVIRYVCAERGQR